MMSCENDDLKLRRLNLDDWPKPVDRCAITLGRSYERLRELLSGSVWTHTNSKHDVDAWLRRVRSEDEDVHAELRWLKLALEELHALMGEVCEND